MQAPEVGSKLEVMVTKVTLGKNGRVYVTLKHPSAYNQPTFDWRVE